jgi:hypothetical protein
MKSTSNNNTNTLKLCLIFSLLVIISTSLSSLFIFQHVPIPTPLLLILPTNKHSNNNDPTTTSNTPCTQITHLTNFTITKVIPNLSPILQLPFYQVFNKQIYFACQHAPILDWVTLTMVTQGEELLHPHLKQEMLKRTMAESKPSLVALTVLRNLSAHPKTALDVFDALYKKSLQPQPDTLKAPLVETFLFSGDVDTKIATSCAMLSNLAYHLPLFDKAKLLVTLTPSLMIRIQKLVINSRYAALAFQQMLLHLADVSQDDNLARMTLIMLQMYEADFDPSNIDNKQENMEIKNNNEIIIDVALQTLRAIPASMGDGQGIKILVDTEAARTVARYLRYAMTLAKISTAAQCLDILSRIASVKPGAQRLLQIDDVMKGLIDVLMNTAIQDHQQQPQQQAAGEVLQLEALRIFAKLARNDDHGILTSERHLLVAEKILYILAKQGVKNEKFAKEGLTAFAHLTAKTPNRISIRKRFSPIPICVRVCDAWCVRPLVAEAFFAAMGNLAVFDEVDRGGAEDGAGELHYERWKPALQLLIDVSRTHSIFTNVAIKACMFAMNWARNEEFQIALDKLGFDFKVQCSDEFKPVNNNNNLGSSSSKSSSSSSESVVVAVSTSNNSIDQQNSTNAEEVDSNTPQ